MVKSTLLHSRVVSLDDKSVLAHYFSLAYVFTVKAIITNFLEDGDVGIFYLLLLKFEFDRSTNNGDRLLDRNHSDIHTDRQPSVLYSISSVKYNTLCIN